MNKVIEALVGIGVSDITRTKLIEKVGDDRLNLLLADAANVMFEGRWNIGNMNDIELRLVLEAEAESLIKNNSAWMSVAIFHGNQKAVTAS